MCLGGGRGRGRGRSSCEARRTVRIRAIELETAREILEEVFGARPGEVEEMIQRRLEGRSWASRSFENVRVGVKEVSERWLKARRALKKEDQVYGQKLAEMAKKHSSF